MIKFLIVRVFNNFRMRVSLRVITSSWYKVEIGIITGCTISGVLFYLDVNMLTKSAEPKYRGPKMKKLVEWGRMRFTQPNQNPWCCKGKVEEKFLFAIAGSAIPTITGNPWRIQGNKSQVRTGRKWRTENAVQEAEASLCHRRLVTGGRAGLGSSTKQIPSKGRKGAT